MIEWLNENQGAAIVIVTSVYVVATLVIMFVSWRTVRRLKEANDLARKALDQAFAIEQNRNRPYVVFDFQVRFRYAYATLKNWGQRPAYDVSCTINPNIIRALGGGISGELSFVNNKVPVLVPGFEFRDLAGWSDFVDKHSETVFEVTLCYRDSEGHEYREVSTLSVAQHQQRFDMGDPDPLKDIARQLSRLVSKLK